MKITSGITDRRGATAYRDGVNFALWSSVAERVELCLIDEHGVQTSLDLPDSKNDVWSGFVPGCDIGQRYGFRVHGEWQPEAGLRCNPAKLLLDPYAKRLSGEFDWQGKVFDYQLEEDGTQTICHADNSQSVPLSVVCSPVTNAASHVRTPWSETIVYECNIRGFTMRHPAVPKNDRGRFSGMKNREVLSYLKALGITTVEVMPTLAFIDEHHLAEKNLRNYWGYNTIGFFAPMPRYAAADPIAELKEMIEAIHDTGLEVVLDVAYNHTGEGDGLGPMLSFRGIDNLAYYRTVPSNPGQYINDTGCGNTINADHPEVQRLILDSLRYLHSDIGFDGFRFDLATIIGRHDHGFSPDHPLLAAISEDSGLSAAKLIAEPWDPGPGGYQLGQFPHRWSEWNDSYRDVVRQFWRGDDHQSGEFAKRFHGSSDIFEHRGRPPSSSVNMITAHDGFTLADVVSFEKRHNESNGEENRDGHQHNFSRNYGAEGSTQNAEILAIRRRQQLNMLATLLFSQGTPMLLSGDELGHSQQGNNNAYAQDNETTWIDWSKLTSNDRFVDQVRDLIWMRRRYSQLRMPDFVHDSGENPTGSRRFQWFDTNAAPMTDASWAGCRSFSIVIGDELGVVLVVVNATEQTKAVTLPSAGVVWRNVFSSHEASASGECGPTFSAESQSITLLNGSAT